MTLKGMKVEIKCEGFSKLHEHGRMSDKEYRKRMKEFVYKPREVIEVPFTVLETKDLEERNE